MTTHPFPPLPALQAAVKGVRDDLTKIRSISTELNKKIAAINNKSQFVASHIVQQTSLLREAASQEVQNYLVREKTYQRFASIAAQGPFWTTRSFLVRQPALPDPELEKFDVAGNQVKLLKAQLTGRFG